MPLLKGEKIILRAMEPADADILYEWENNPEIWRVSHTVTPFSKALLKTFIEVAAKDIYTNKQLRLMIEEQKTGITIGTIDLFDFDPIHQRAGIGILIDTKYRNQGFAHDTIKVIKEYAFHVLLLHQLYCNILEDNIESRKLFTNEGFVLVGNKKEWIKTENGFKNELLLQCIIS
ncbi:MAG: GNAT family N-acetyltransferase [Bacteroidales bacterium]|jgi:diamine N-acetyltransferase|nr:GNAT family N-acetyltransferase [Bacteroidales bacterium]